MFIKVDYSEFLEKVKFKNFNPNLITTELKNYDFNSNKKYNCSEMKIVEELLNNVKFQFFLASYVMNKSQISFDLEKRNSKIEEIMCKIFRFVELEEYKEKDKSKFVLQMQPYDNFVEKFKKKVLDREIDETIYELYFKNSTAKKHRCDNLYYVYDTSFKLKEHKNNLNSKEFIDFIVDYINFNKGIIFKIYVGLDELNGSYFIEKLSEKFKVAAMESNLNDEKEYILLYVISNFN